MEFVLPQIELWLYSKVKIILKKCRQVYFQDFKLSICTGHNCSKEVSLVMSFLEWLLLS